MVSVVRAGAWRLLLEEVDASGLGALSPITLKSLITSPKAILLMMSLHI